MLEGVDEENLSEMEFEEAPRCMDVQLQEVSASIG